MNLSVTPVFNRLRLAQASGRYNVYVFEGGSRSSKTYSIIQFFIVWAFSQKKPKRVICTRKRGTWLLATVWVDFTKLIYELKVDAKINNSLHFIRINGVTFEFIGSDDTQRLHGLTCDAFWINEAMEEVKDDFDQLEQRCADFSILDYNPTAEEHWIYDNVCKRSDCYFDHSTMLDNPFIPLNMKRKILSYEPTEANYENGTVDIRKWKIYGLGERAKIEGLIFSDVNFITEIPLWVKQRWRGIDWGFTHDPTAIVQVGFYKNAVYIDEECYATGMLNGDIIRKLRTLPPLKIWADNAEPKTIKEISNAGFFIQGAKKGAGSILDGLQFMQGFQIYLTERSVNLKREFNNYTWAQDKSGKWQDFPAGGYDHGIDAVRYILTMELMGKKDKDRINDNTNEAFAR